MSRRRFGWALTAGTAALLAGLREGRAHSKPEAPGGGLTDIAGLKVGHFTDPRRPTGCTVVLVEAGAVAGVDVRGGAPGTRETDLLDPLNVVERVHAVVLSGGSAYGLDTAGGVMRWLEERGIGFAVGEARVPIVPAAILFDLAIGDWRIRPDASAGYAAAQAAAGGPVPQGNVGAGAGASVGKLFGSARAMKGGLGTAALHLPDGLIVAALVVVNAVGDVVDPATGRLVAGARRANGRGLEDSLAAILAGRLETPAPDRATQGARGNTTIGVVATNAALTKAAAAKVAQMAHDGLARTIRPVHTPWDGDTLFALSHGTRAADTLVIGTLAAEAVAQAVLAGVQAAKSLPGLPAAGDLTS